MIRPLEGERTAYAPEWGLPSGSWQSLALYGLRAPRHQPGTTGLSTSAERREPPDGDLTRKGHATLHGIEIVILPGGQFHSAEIDQITAIRNNCVFCLGA